MGGAGKLTSAIFTYIFSFMFVIRGGGRLLAMLFLATAMTYGVVAISMVRCTTHGAIDNVVVIKEIAVANRTFAI